MEYVHRSNSKLNNRATRYQNAPRGRINEISLVARENGWEAGNPLSYTGISIPAVYLELPKHVAEPWYSLCNSPGQICFVPLTSIFVYISLYVTENIYLLPHLSILGVRFHSAVRFSEILIGS